jgi:hypothetical protein
VLKILTLTLAATLATDATAADTTGNSMLEPCEHYLSNTNANDLMLQGMCVGVPAAIAAVGPDTVTAGWPLGLSGRSRPSFLAHDEALREHTLPLWVHSAPFLRDLVILKERPGLRLIEAMRGIEKFAETVP